MISYVLLSGGMDSLAALEVALRETEVASCLFFKYGYMPSSYGAARNICSRYKVTFLPIDVVGVLPPGYAVGLGKENYYLPDRNLLFLVLSSIKAKSEGVDFLYTGISRGSPLIYDITPEFVSRLNGLLELDNTSVRVRAPYVASEKTTILRDLLEVYHSPVGLTHSCFVEGDGPCGVCPACARRIESFKELGVQDPANYPNVNWEECVPWKEYKGAAIGG